MRRKRASLRQQTLDAEGRARQLESQLKDMEAKIRPGHGDHAGRRVVRHNQAQLKSGGMRNVQKLADFSSDPQRNVMIEGFTDSTGGKPGATVLSDDRAYAVRAALLGMGIGTGASARGLRRIPIRWPATTPPPGAS